MTSLNRRDAGAASIFDYDELYRLAKKNYESYISAAPFPHIVLDDIVATEAVTSAEGEFEGTFKEIEKHFYGAVGKFTTSTRKHWGPWTTALLQEFNSAEFLQFLEWLTGIDGLISDPYYEGGGIHQIKKGGFLKVHTDFNHHKKLKLDRRVNLLLYLSHDWQESYGGHLELWDSEMRNCEKRVLPVANRIVVFSTTDFSFHGHPEPLTCPDDRSRKSLALYYYTNGRPEDEVVLGKTIRTNYQPRPGEALDRGIINFLKHRLRSSLKKLKRSSP